MSEEIEKQISKERRDKIDALSKEDLQYEINRGRESRLGRQMLPYAQHRLKQIEEAERDETRNQDIALSKEANRLSAEANDISRKANKHSWWAIIISIVAAVVGAVAILVG